jgi:anti-sigma factor RsiW
MELTCTHARARLSGYLERALVPAEREAVGRHLAACRACDEVFAELRGVVGVLHELDRVDLPEGFEARFARRLEAEARVFRPVATAAPATRGQRWWADWFTFAGWPVRALAGAAVAVVLFFAFLTSGPHRGPVALPGTRAVPISAPAAAPRIDLGQDALVRIWFDAAKDVGPVRFTLELPAGVRMVKNGRLVDSASVTWEGKLKAGRNVIPLHVRGVARGEWTVTAKVERDGAERASSIGLNVDGA